jgi:hypothetical protein
MFNRINESPRVYDTIYYRKAESLADFVLGLIILTLLMTRAIVGGLGDRLFGSLIFAAGVVLWVMVQSERGGRRGRSVR